MDIPVTAAMTLTGVDAANYVLDGQPLLMLQSLLQH